MATLQKFKLLATQCAVAAASPSRSPVIQLRRRKTLRMLLYRNDHRGGFFSRDDLTDLRADPNRTLQDKKKKKEKKKKKNEEVRIRHKLKDLFVSSPPLEDRVSDKRFEQEEAEAEERAVGFFLASGSSDGGTPAPRREGNGGAGSFTTTFRYRLLRRAWRPVLVSITE
ncbi:hypothetical protein I3760_04G042600 [Carya illinoinensis]|nr:hypothetical protein I3760_04G042600 [Carya illinoinensis]